MNYRSMLALTTTALLASAAFVLGTPAVAADVTPERLANADKEPHNCLMNHRTYDGQRFSPLDRINKQNVKSPSDSGCMLNVARRIAALAVFIAWSHNIAAVAQHSGFAQPASGSWGFDLSGA